MPPAEPDVMRLWKLAMVGCVTLPVTTASAFVIKTASSGAPAHWDDSEVTFTPEFTPGPAEVSAEAASSVLATSIATWNAALSRSDVRVKLADGVAGAVSPTNARTGAWATVVASDGSQTVAVAHDIDGVNTVRWGFDNDPDIEVGVQGLTFVGFRTADGVITDTDIVINADDFKWATTITGCENEYDLESALTHEMGHALGLAHSLETDATMFKTGARCETKKRDLSDDDKAGITTIYRPGACSAGGDSAAGCSALLLAFALGWSTRRRPRRRRRDCGVVVAWSVATAIVAPSTVDAARLRRLELAELARDAVVVVRGRVVSESVTPDGPIETDVTIAVEECLGETAVGCPSTVRVRRRGGERDGRGLWVDSEAVPAIGSHVVAYLRADARGRLRVLGGVQGMLKVVTVGAQTFAVRDLRGHDTLIEGAWRPDNLDIIELSLVRERTIKQRVRSR